MTQTSTGIKLSISSGIPATYDLSGYGALTYFEIGEVTNIPQFGAQFQTVTNQPLATGITEKRKGFVNYGDPVIDMALDGSNMGQQMMKSACDGIRKSQVHAFMLQYGNGEIRYWSGRVFSFQEAPGSANNMVGATSQIGITRAILQIPRITLDLDFANDYYSLLAEPKSFSDIITFSRSTTSTYFNSSGVLTTAAINEPCLAYDPSTLEPLGLQIFGAATNLLTYSEQFDNAAWSQPSSSVSPSEETAPDGLTAADRVTRISGGGRVQQSKILNAQAYTFSIYIKDGSYDGARILIYNNTKGGTVKILDIADISQLPLAYNGFGRAEVSFSQPDGVGIADGDSIAIYIYTDSSGGAVDGSFLYLWGAQLETGSIATPYIKTEASQVTRAADIATVDDLSGWYNQSQGSVYTEFAASGVRTGASQFVAHLSGSGDTYYNKLDVTSGKLAVTSIINSTNVTTNSSTSSDTSPHKMSFNVGGGISVDGEHFDMSSALLAADKLSLGSNGAGSSALYGHIKTLNYYPSALTENEMKLITL